MAEKIKPELQELIKNIEIEERGKEPQSDVGQCLEFFLEEKMFGEIIGQSMNNRPHGILFLSIKFCMFMIKVVKSADILVLSENHQALFQLLQFIYNSLKNDMDVMRDMKQVDKKILLDFLLELTIKITYESPHIAEMLLADQSSKSRKEKQFDYVPLQIVLWLFLMDDNKEAVENTIALRKVLLLMLKQAVMNPKIKDYVLNESELPILLVAKLAHIYSYLPDQLSLIRNPNVTERYPTPDVDPCLRHLNLLEQIKQSFGKEMVQAHCEFVKYCSFFNLVAETVQMDSKIGLQLNVCLFNNFLVDILQGRILDSDTLRRRTALQYFEQMLDVFTCSDLIITLFQFFSGLPVKTKEEEEMEEFDDESDVSSYHSRVSVSIEGGRLSIDRKHVRGRPNVYDSGRDSDLFEESLRGAVEGNGILAHFKQRMNVINLKTKNMEAGLAIRGPADHLKSIEGSVTQSVAYAYARGKINDQKKDNMINLLDSILRRNKDGEDDVMIDDDEVVDVQTKEMNHHELLLKKGRLDFFYNRKDHKLSKLFYHLVQPEDEEKMPLVTFRIIDGFLAKQIPKILDFFIFGSLKRVLQRTDWLKPASEEIQMHPINELKQSFVRKFPAADAQVDLGQVAHQIGKVDLSYYINNENMMTGDPRENFDSRKTKIKDDNYQSLYDQLVQEWYQSDTLFQNYDGAILQSPKYTRNRKLRKSRMAYLREPENMDEEDMEELSASPLNKLRISRTGQVATTYTFEMLAELIAQKDDDVEFSDLNSETSEEDDQMEDG